MSPTRIALAAVFTLLVGTTAAAETVVIKFASMAPKGSAWDLSIRETVEAATFGAERGLRVEITVSIGVSTYPQHGGDRDSLLDVADKAMYLGKAQGRNQVCSADELTPTPSTGRL